MSATSEGSHTRPGGEAITGRIAPGIWAAYLEGFAETAPAGSWICDGDDSLLAGTENILRLVSSVRQSMRNESEAKKSGYDDGQFLSHGYEAVS